METKNFKGWREWDKKKEPVNKQTEAHIGSNGPTQSHKSLLGFISRTLTLYNVINRPCFFSFFVCSAWSYYIFSLPINLSLEAHRRGTRCIASNMRYSEDLSSCIAYRLVSAVFVVLYSVFSWNDCICSVCSSLIDTWGETIG